MASYRMHGQVLVVTVGAASVEERSALYDTIRQDPEIPDGSPLLFDTLLLPEQLSDELLAERVPSMLTHLGSKAGSVCGIIATPAQWPTSRVFQVVSHGHHLRVGIFPNSTSARRWLDVYVRRALSLPQESPIVAVPCPNCQAPESIAVARHFEDVSMVCEKCAHAWQADAGSSSALRALKAYTPGTGIYDASSRRTT